MGWIQGVARQFRESFSKTAIDDSAKWTWRVLLLGLGAIGAVVLLALRHWLFQAWANGPVVGAAAGFCFVVLVMLSAHVANKIQARRRRAVVVVAPSDNVAFVRQLHINYFAPSIKSATSYLAWLCEQMGSMPPLAQLFASLLTSEILDPCSTTMAEVGRQVATVVPGSISAEDFDSLKNGFGDLAFKYSRVARWIELVKKVILGRQGSPEYDLLSSQHEALVAELNKADGYYGLKELTTSYGILAQLLPASPAASPPSSTASV
jgi:hypothetical protein